MGGVCGSTFHPGAGELLRLCPCAAGSGMEHGSSSAPRMEVRAWDGSRLPTPTLTLVPTSSPAPHPKTGLGCSALCHGWGLFMPRFPLLGSSGVHNTLVEYLGVSLHPSIHPSAWQQA